MKLISTVENLGFENFHLLATSSLNLQGTKAPLYLFMHINEHMPMKLYEQFFRFTFFKQQSIYQQTIEVVILAYCC